MVRRGKDCKFNSERRVACIQFKGKTVRGDSGAVRNSVPQFAQRKKISSWNRPTKGYAVSGFNRSAYASGRETFGVGRSRTPPVEEQLRSDRKTAAYFSTNDARPEQSHVPAGPAFLRGCDIDEAEEKKSSASTKAATTSVEIKQYGKSQTALALAGLAGNLPPNSPIKTKSEEQAAKVNNKILPR